MHAYPARPPAAEVKGGHIQPLPPAPLSYPLQVQGLCRPLACVMACSLAVGAYYSAAAAGAVPLWPALKTIASAPFGLTSFAVSLLLVFR